MIQTNKIVSLLLVLVTFAAVYGLALGFSNSGRLGTIETKTCKVQKRGLEATPYLIGFVEESNKALARVTPRQLAALPREAREIIGRLRFNADHYTKIEHLQPKTRSC